MDKGGPISSFVCVNGTQELHNNGSRGHEGYTVTNVLYNLIFTHGFSAEQADKTFLVDNSA